MTHKRQSFACFWNWRYVEVPSSFSYNSVRATTPSFRPASAFSALAITMFSWVVDDSIFAASFGLFQLLFNERFPVAWCRFVDGVRVPS